MHYAKALVSSLAISVAYAQSIPEEVAKLPACALTCLTPAVTGHGCSITDYACQCGSARGGITQQAAPCIAKACSAQDAANVQSITNQICALAGQGTATNGGTTSPATATNGATTTDTAAATTTTTNGGNSPSPAATTLASTPNAASGRLDAVAGVVGVALVAAFAL